MKETFDILYGKEIRWFEGLSIRNRWIVIYAILSAILVISVWSENIWVEIVLIVNMMNALRLARQVKGNGLEE